MGRRARACFALVAALGVALPACYRRIELVDRIDAGPALDAFVPVPDAAPDAATRAWVEPTGRCLAASGVDLLVVVDSSTSMAEEQAALARAFPTLVRALLEPPDLDGDGSADWPPVTDLHIGVTTTDLGADDFFTPTCATGRGDDGILRTVGSTTIAGCAPSYPPFLTFAAGGDVDALAMDFSCVSAVGTGGCGFEQPLEAALEAIAVSAPTAYTLPTYEPPLFAGRSGHGDGRNAGFVRDGTLLAILVITDEEDCSLADRSLLELASPTYGSVDLNLRCFAFPDALHPVERYVEGLSALRARRPDQLALAVLAGLPPELAVARPTQSDFEAMLADPAMSERVSPDEPTRLATSCESSAGLAFPPRRLVRLAQSLGEGRATVQSICDTDFDAQVEAFGRLFGRRACSAREGDPLTLF